MVPVDLLETGERVAWLCEACGEQLPADFLKTGSCWKCHKPVLDFGRLEPDGTPHPCGQLNLAGMTMAEYTRNDEIRKAFMADRNLLSW